MLYSLDITIGPEVPAGLLRTLGVGEMNMSSMKERRSPYSQLGEHPETWYSWLTAELETSGRPICFHTEIVCLGMEPTEEGKAKLWRERGQELMSSF